MRIMQFKGPFTAGKSISFPYIEGRKYKHLGIQAPFSQPMIYVNLGIGYEIIGDSAIEPDITINNHEGQKISSFAVNACGILEFDDLDTNFIEIVFNKNLPYNTIIEATYTE